MLTSLALDNITSELGLFPLSSRCALRSSSYCMFAWRENGRIWRKDERGGRRIRSKLILLPTCLLFYIPMHIITHFIHTLCACSTHCCSGAAFPVFQLVLLSYSPLESSSLRGHQRAHTVLPGEHHRAGHQHKAHPHTHYLQHGDHHPQPAPPLCVSLLCGSFHCGDRTL